MPQTEVDELKDIFKEHGDQNSLPIRDVPANTELKQVFCLGDIYFFSSYINSSHYLYQNFDQWLIIFALILLGTV